MLVNGGTECPARVTLTEVVRIGISTQLGCNLLGELLCLRGVKEPVGTDDPAEKQNPLVGADDPDRSESPGLVETYGVPVSCVDCRMHGVACG
jgi:hypothetical protein